MPTFNITSLSKDPSFHFGRTEVFCVMAYPNADEDGAESRGRLLYELSTQGLNSPDAANAVEDLVPEDRQHLDQFELLLLRKISTVGRTSILDDARMQARKGMVAGDVLRFALRCGLYRPEHRSVSKAIFTESQRSIGNPNSLSMREVTVGRYWSEFRPVAHLYAAFAMLEEQGIQLEEDSLPTELVDFDNAAERKELRELAQAMTPFSLFLSLADAISEAAHHQLPPTGRSSSKDSRDGRRLIDRKEIIRIKGGPERYPVEFLLRDLTVHELELLGKYRRYRSLKRVRSK
jgi:hypothetical protein